MTASPETLYLDLVKKTLAFSLWPEPPIPIDALYARSSPPKRILVSVVSRTLRSLRLQLALDRAITAKEREEGSFWPAYAFTMIGQRRLDNLQSCVETVLRERVDGDLIETGIWRGGACILMRAILAAHGVQDRKVFVADSFEGLPKPDPRFPVDKGDTRHKSRYLAVTQAQVEDNFARFGLLDHQVVFLKGWFRDTLPTAPIHKLAVLRLDGDMYGSTMDALESLYPKLSQGGFCIVDDYAIRGCRQAVEDYRMQNEIRAELHEIDWTGRYWRKVD